MEVNYKNPSKSLIFTLYSVFHLYYVMFNYYHYHYHYCYYFYLPHNNNYQ